MHRTRADNQLLKTNAALGFDSEARSAGVQLEALCPRLGLLRISQRTTQTGRISNICEKRHFVFIYSRKEQQRFH